MSSARDEQPDTVPPPAGEDDAYSAATKVGAMPAELMARLRAEGLLPDEDVEPKRPVPPRPSSNLAARSTPMMPPPGADAPNESAFDDVPSLYSEPPPADLSDASVPVLHSSAPPPPMPASSAIPDPSRGVSTSSASPQLETPVAFATPPSSAPPLSAAPLAGPGAEMPVAPFAGKDARATGRSTTQTIAVVVAVIVAFLAFAFAMAVLSQRR